MYSLIFINREIVESATYIEQCKNLSEELIAAINRVLPHTPLDQQVT